mgnify:CR=1 FL=1
MTHPLHVLLCASFALFCCAHLIGPSGSIEVATSPRSEVAKKEIVLIKAGVT